MQRKFHGGPVDPSISEQTSKAIVDQWSFRALAAAVVEHRALMIAQKRLECHCLTLLSDPHVLKMAWRTDDLLKSMYQPNLAV